MDLKIILQEKIKIISAIILILFPGCGNDPVTGEETVFDKNEVLLESVWQVYRITVKHGTDDPDDSVPLSQMEEVISGSTLDGELDFNPDGTINVYNASEDFCFRGFEDLQWEYENDFIRFSWEHGSFGYNVQWSGPDYMRWYIEGRGIESGALNVTIYELRKYFMKIN